MWASVVERQEVWSLSLSKYSRLVLNLCVCFCVCVCVCVCARVGRPARLWREGEVHDARSLCKYAAAFKGALRNILAPITVNLLYEGQNISLYV